MLMCYLKTGCFFFKPNPLFILKVTFTVTLSNVIRRSQKEILGGWLIVPVSVHLILYYKYLFCTRRYNKILDYKGLSRPCYS